MLTQPVSNTQLVIPQPSTPKCVSVPTRRCARDGGYVGGALLLLGCCCCCRSGSAGCRHDQELPHSAPTRQVLQCDAAARAGGGLELARGGDVAWLSDSAAAMRCWKRIRTRTSRTQG